LIKVNICIIYFLYKILWLNCHQKFVDWNLLQTIFLFHITLATLIIRTWSTWIIQWPYETEQEKYNIFFNKNTGVIGGNICHRCDVIRWLIGEPNNNAFGISEMICFAQFHSFQRLYKIMYDVTQNTLNALLLRLHFLFVTTCIHVHALLSGE
jgi:hypothetical protein